jgi:hypothetical protein
VDISEPTRPRVLGTHGTFDYARGVAVKDNFAFVADSDAGLAVFDVTDPSRLSVVGHAETSGQAFGIDVVGNYVYVADLDGGLKVFRWGAPGLLRLANPSRVRNTFSVEVMTVLGSNYVLQFKESLSDDAWGALPGVCGQGGPTVLTDLNATSLRRFYRVRVE